jgi:hypothetical protein
VTTTDATQALETQLLEFIAGITALGAEGKQSDRIALAARIRLPSQVVARVLGMSPAAAKKALERARAAA